MRFELPDAVLGRARSVGEIGKQWLATLDARIAEREAAWQIRAESVLTGGTESLVLTAIGTDGTPAVLKLGLPGTSDLEREGRILDYACGRGYVRLLARDAGSNALLLERLGPAIAAMHTNAQRADPATTQGSDPETSHAKGSDARGSDPGPADSEDSDAEGSDAEGSDSEGSDSFDNALCDALLEAWRPVPADLDLMTGAEKAHWLADYISERYAALAPPCPASLVEHARRLCAARAAAHSPARAVLAHGDPHANNLLAAGDGRWCFVDPDGLAAEREYDLGVIAREWSDAAFMADPARVHARRCANLAARTGCDAEAIGAWGEIERISSAFACFDIGLDAVGARLITAATALHEAR